jgi:hypothetical protein
MTGRRGRRRKQLLDDLKEIERGSTISHPVENSLWKRLRTRHKTDYRMNECDLYTWRSKYILQKVLSVCLSVS